jgi:hypothetical protein
MVQESDVIGSVASVKSEDLVKVATSMLVKCFVVKLLEFKH